VAAGGLAALAVAVLLVAALTTGAQAAAGLGVTANINNGSAVTVGQTAVPANYTVTNVSDGPQSSLTLTLASMTMVPACGSTNVGDVHCTTAANQDPGVFTASATGTGAAGTACAGVTFTISTNATTGEFTFTPPSAIVLGSSSVGGGLAKCTINFLVTVNKTPTHDANGGVTGVQTAQLSQATGATSDGQPAEGTGSAQLTVTPLTPTVATSIHNAAHTVVTSVPVGTIVHDSVTVTGSGATPTGNVTVSWFTNGTCTGTAAATSSATALVAGTVDVTGFTQTPAASGSFAFQASYAGNAT
jgi:hypothetical protein